MNRDLLRLTQKFFFFCLLLVSTAIYALPFNIVPQAGTSLPTSVVEGGTATACYTVTNSTASPRNNNYVKYLPPNVSQVTSGGSCGGTICGTTFNLAAHGQANASCNLQLTVSGAVNSNDLDNRHHLFVCFPGGTTCAGTPYQLDTTQIPTIGLLTSITVTPSSASIGIGATQQFTATGHYSNGSTQNITSSVAWTSSTGAATINSSGLATGASTSGSPTTITATLSPGTPGTATLTVTSATLSSISVSPTSASIANGTTQQFTATGHYSDGSTQDLTDLTPFQ
jgi:hypothetical protein